MTRLPSLSHLFSAIAALAALILNNAPAVADCASDAKALVGKLSKLPPYHIAIKTASNGIESRMTGDVVMPSSFKLVFGDTAMVMTPRGAWMSVKGKWQPQSDVMAKQMRKTLVHGITQGLAYRKNTVCDPAAKINGKSYKSIQFDVFDSPKDKAAIAKTTFYLGASGLPLWMITQGYSAKGNSVVVQQFKYDPAIRIVDPH